ncbi:MAG: hypothetical protein ACJ8BF_13695 [Gemmatimonadales bacterium]
MPIVLPYEFDTSGVVKVILRGTAAVLLVVLLGIGYSLLVSHDHIAAVQLLLIAAIAGYFARLLHRNLTGTVGTISSDAIVVEPVELFGIRLAGPAGRFPIGRFDAVRVDCITHPVSIPLETQIRPHERVYLVGKEGTPDILIARTDRDVGRLLGRELAAGLSLPYRDQEAPY